MPEPTILVAEDADSVSQKLARCLKEEIEAFFQSDDGSYFVVGLSGGSLPNFLVPAISDHLQMDIDWHRVKFIFCDERMVPETDPESTFGIYKSKLIGKVEGIDESNFLTVDTSLDVKDASEKYAEDLSKLNKGTPFPRFNVLLLGMGPDGHTCSLFPGHPLLDEKTLVVAPISDSPKPPPERVTLTYPVLNACKAAIIVSTGEGKKDIIEKILKLKEDFPAGRVQPSDGKLIWVLDSAAAQKL